MKTVTLFLLTALVWGASSARGEEPPVPARGFLSALGLGLVIVGGSAIALGVSGLSGSNQAALRLDAYGPGPILAGDEAAVVALRDRVSTQRALGATGLIGGGLALLGGVSCVLLDGRRSTAGVTMLPTSQGGFLIFSGTF